MSKINWRGIANLFEFLKPFRYVLIYLRIMVMWVLSLAFKVGYRRYLSYYAFAVQNPLKNLSVVQMLAYNASRQKRHLKGGEEKPT